MTTATAEHSDSHDDVASQKPSYDDINVPVIVLVGILSAILTFVTIAAVQGMCYHWQNSKIKARSYEVVSMPSRVYIDEQKKVLAGGDGIVPIEDAMKSIVDEFGK